MSGSTSFSPSSQDTPEIAYRNWLIHFDRNRRTMEKYVAGLPKESAQKFEIAINWMRQVIAKEAPELLNE
ncbi:MAG: hypothetical protein ACFFB3_10370 [Candidatus Hodarchaeota archaeon]